MLFCEQCGNQLNDNAKFCQFCGNPINVPNPTYAQQNNSPPQVYSQQQTYQQPMYEQQQQPTAQQIPVLQGFKKRIIKKAINEIINVCIYLFISVWCLWGIHATSSLSASDETEQFLHSTLFTFMILFIVLVALYFLIAAIGNLVLAIKDFYYVNQKSVYPVGILRDYESESSPDGFSIGLLTQCSNEVNYNLTKEYIKVNYQLLKNIEDWFSAANGANLTYEQQQQLAGAFTATPVKPQKTWFIAVKSFFNV